MILLAGLGGSLGIVALSAWNGALLNENGPFEMLQLGALFAAVLLFARASATLIGSAGRLALGLAAFSLLFLVRELPRCTSPFYAAGPCMPGDTKIYAYFLPVFLVALLILRNRALLPPARRWWEIVPSLRFLFRVTPILAVAALLGVGQWADGGNLPLLEETAELMAYLLLSLAGLAAAQTADRERGERPQRGVPASGVWTTR